MFQLCFSHETGAVRIGGISPAVTIHKLNGVDGKNCSRYSKGPFVIYVWNYIRIYESPGNFPKGSVSLLVESVNT